MNIYALDVKYLQLDGAANVFLIEGVNGYALIECGTAATWATLEQRLEEHGVHPTQITDVLLTHIHLDHAGAAGHLAAGGSRIWVHSIGRAHLMDPTKLIASSRRVHGEMYEQYYGDLWAVAESQAIEVADGQVITAAGLSFCAIETAGHARHHHSWKLECDNQCHIFVGDVLGIAVPKSDFISIPTPPPEFDPLAWKRSLARLRQESPTHFWLTHGALQSTSIEASLALLDRVQLRLDQEIAWLEPMAKKIIAAGARDSDAYHHAFAHALQHYGAMLKPEAIAAGVSKEYVNQFLGDYFLRMNLQGATRWASTIANTDHLAGPKST